MRQLYRELQAAGYQPWLDEEDLLPGQDWEHEIVQAVRAADVVLVCLSAASVTKSGYVQKEVRFALDVADEQPEGAIFLIPVKVEECEVPLRLRRWHWVNLFEQGGLDRLLRALARRSGDGPAPATIAETTANTAFTAPDVPVDKPAHDESKRDRTALELYEILHELMDEIYGSPGSGPVIPSFQELRPETTFGELGIDSVDSVELVMATEERYGIEIPDDEAEKLLTLGDALRYVVDRLDA